MKRDRETVAALIKGCKLASGSARAAAHAEQVAFFAAVRAGIDKLDPGRGTQASDKTDVAVQQLVNSAVASTEVVDILEACGFDRPDISVPSEEFMPEISGAGHETPAVEALKQLLDGEISARMRGNAANKEGVSARLEQAIKRYHDRSVDALQVLPDLIEIARDLRAQPDDDLTDEERAFCDALARNRSAAELTTNDELRVIATELVATVRRNAGPDR